MAASENRRTSMTKKLLQNSLIEILEKKSIHDITIKEICDNADVNRSTFYRHYNTPHKLFDEIYNNVYHDIIDIAKQFHMPNFNSVEVMTNILNYCEENRRLCMVLLSENGELNIGKNFSDLVTRAVMENPDSQTSELNLYVIQFMAAGMANFIWNWLNNENRLPAHTVAKSMMMFINHGIGRALSLTPAPEHRVSCK